MSTTADPVAEAARRRTFAIISHPDAGKTTLTEKLLLYGGALGREAWVGGLTALVTGYVALVILRHIILVGRMWTFAIYLVPLGFFLVTR